MVLADDFPLLASLVEQRAGGQRRLPMAGSGRASAILRLAPSRSPLRSSVARRRWRRDLREPGAGGGTRSEGGTPTPPALPGDETTTAEARLPGGRGAERSPGRYGLTIQFEARPEDPELARLVESTVWINEAHPAYRRAAASRSEGYHIALASALALASLAVEPAKEHAFVTAFLASWGAAMDRDKPAGRR